MIKSKIVFIIPFVILLAFSAHSFSQKKYDLRFNSGFSFIAYGDRFSYGFDVNWSPYWITSFRLKNHEFLAGTFHQIESESTSPGPMIGYRFYLFKELTRLNVFFNYVFMYSPNKRVEYSRQGTFSYRDDNYYNIIGCGFNVFIDKQHRLGFTGTMNYPIFIEKNSNWIYCYWRAMAFTTGLTFKIPLSK